MSLIKSFKFALRGIIYCIKNERNMRIHTVAVFFVFVFSFFFELSRVEYAVLFLTFAVVISAEMMNTATEELTDMLSESYSPMARISKDVAAGAVIISAIFAVFIGIVLFWKPDKFLVIYNFFLANPFSIIILAALLAVSVAYISWGPTGIKERLHKKINK